MARLYADENFHHGVVQELRNLGHDVVTAHQAGQASQGIPDPAVLAYATGLGRAVLTYNRRHFVRLHRSSPNHSGIIVCTVDHDSPALAQRIHQALAKETTLDNKLISINKPARP